MKIKFNVRVNSSLLYLFSHIGSKKYRIKTISKFFINRLEYYLNLVKTDEFTITDFISPTFNYYSLNKNYTITLDSVYISKLKELSSFLSITETECFRRIIQFTCFSEMNLLPQPVVCEENRVKDDTYTKFRFSVNKELLSTYKELCSSFSLETNLTAALNDAIKESLTKIRKNDSSYIENILSEDILSIKNDYKYNFKISNKRFEDFNRICESLGLSPQECLRKSISFYVKDKTREKKEIKIK